MNAEKSKITGARVENGKAVFGAFDFGSNTNESISQFSYHVVPKYVSKNEDISVIFNNYAGYNVF